jgi:glucokinase
MEKTNFHLVADIGGTNARFALVSAGKLELILPATLACEDFSGLQEAIELYFSTLPSDFKLRPTVGCIAVAGPVMEDRVRLTNRAWDFSIESLRGALGFVELLLLNDFSAMARALPCLGEADHIKIGGGNMARRGPMAVLGPGTGAGVGVLIPVGDSWELVASEGGHTGFSPSSHLEIELLQLLSQDNKRVPIEHLLSANGLVILHQALAKLEGRQQEVLEPATITDRGTSEEDVNCRRVLELFCAILGSFAGDVALMFCATGGVYLGGGILPRIQNFLATSEFRNRFEDKDRLRKYLENIETHLITIENPALLGAAAWLNQKFP